MQDHKLQYFWPGKFDGLGIYNPGSLERCLDWYRIDCTIINETELRHELRDGGARVVVGDLVCGSA